MVLTTNTLPPVSRQFYDKLVSAFPPLNPLDINSNTTMIDIQRNAAQQQVIKYIENSVSNGKYINKEVNIRSSLFSRLKYILLNK